MAFAVVFLFFLRARDPESLDWIFTAGGVRHFNESDGLQLVYGDLIGRRSSLQTPPRASNWLFISKTRRLADIT